MANNDRFLRVLFSVKLPRRGVVGNDPDYLPGVSIS